MPERLKKGTGNAKCRLCDLRSSKDPRAIWMDRGHVIEPISWGRSNWNKSWSEGLVWNSVMLVLDSTPGQLSCQSTSSSKGHLFVSFILKGESLDLTRPNGNHHAKAAGLFNVLFSKGQRRFIPLYRKGDITVNNNFSLWHGHPRSDISEPYKTPSGFGVIFVRLVLKVLDVISDWPVGN